ncbi:MAG: nodulation protein NfeD [Nitrospirae bacterium]|nr:nodulation protein NfeD [Nitrospirota bacterium]
MAIKIYIKVLMPIYFLLGIAAAATANSPQIDVLEYEGIINPPAAEFIAKSIKESTERKAAALIIRLDTPGGLDQSMRVIVKDIIASEVPVIVYVSPSGARAASAGTFITMSAHIAAMAPGTNIGAAHPVSIGGDDVKKDMAAKIENDAAAYIKGIAQKRGKNEQWAEDAVRKSVSVTAEEALKLKVIDLVAKDIDELLTAVNGKKVITEKGEVMLNTKGAKTNNVEMGFRTRILRLLADPNVAYILLILGIYGIFFELSSPGAILPGVVGGIFLILAFYGLQTLPINYAGLMLILLAIILFIAEVKVTSYGLLTIGGIISMFIGSLMLIDTELEFLRISWTVIIPAVLMTALFFTIAVSLVYKAYKRQPTTGREGLVGAIGIANSAISPKGLPVGRHGKVFVEGEIWDARSDEEIKEGEEIEIVEVEGLLLKVKKHRR